MVQRVYIRFGIRASSNTIEVVNFVFSSLFDENAPRKDSESLMHILDE